MTNVPIIMSRIEIEQRGLASCTVGVSAKDKCADRPDQIGCAECPERKQQGNRFVASREEQAGDGDGEISVNQQIEPFERVADRGGQDNAPLWVGGRRRGRTVIGRTSCNFMGAPIGGLIKWTGHFPSELPKLPSCDVDGSAAASPAIGSPMHQIATVAPGQDRHNPCDGSEGGDRRRGLSPGAWSPSFAAQQFHLC